MAKHYRNYIKNGQHPNKTNRRIKLKSVKTK